LLTAARPGEIIAMKGGDLETSGRIWFYRPPRHKNAYRGHERTIYLGPRAQAIVKVFLKRDTQAPLFSPRDAKEAEWKERRQNRQTPMTPSQAKRTRKAKPKRPPGDCYSLASYSRCIVRACEKAGVPQWHPHQLRHTAATSLRKEFGLDMARCILGHRSPAITEIYAELDHEKAMEVIQRIG
jgi:integrase